MVNARDIYHKLQVDDCESLGCVASEGVFQFLKKKETEPARWEAPESGLSGRGCPAQGVSHSGSRWPGPGQG